LLSFAESTFVGISNLLLPLASAFAVMGWLIHPASPLISKLPTRTETKIALWNVGMSWVLLAYIIAQVFYIFNREINHPADAG
jgi:hypothetical protein